MIERKRYGIFARRESGAYDVYFDRNRATRTDQIYRQADGEIALSTGNLRIAGRLERSAAQPSLLKKVYVREVRPLQVGEVRKSIPVNSMPDSRGWAVTYELEFYGLANTAASCEILVELLEKEPFVVRAGSNGHLVVDHVGNEQEVSRPKEFFESIETTLRWQLAEMSETTCTHGSNCYECPVDNCELPMMAVLIGSYAEMT